MHTGSYTLASVDVLLHSLFAVVFSLDSSSTVSSLLRLIVSKSLFIVNRLLHFRWYTMFGRWFSSTVFATSKTGWWFWTSVPTKSWCPLGTQDVSPPCHDMQHSVYTLALVLFHSVWIQKTSSVNWEFTWINVMFNFNSTANNINDKSSEILMDADFSILFFSLFPKSVVISL